MIYTFKLEESDFLTNQLFLASNSKMAMRNRRRGWFWLTGLFLVLALFFYFDGDALLRNYFAILTVVALIFYPYYTRWRYKRHYLRFIRERHASAFGATAYVSFDEDHVRCKDDLGSESKISNTQISALHELPDHFIVRLDGGQSLIIPKHEIADAEQIKADLNKLGAKIDKPLIDNLDWKWK